MDFPLLGAGRSAGSNQHPLRPCNSIWQTNLPSLLFLIDPKSDHCIARGQRNRLAQKNKIWPHLGDGN